MYRARVVSAVLTLVAVGAGAAERRHFPMPPPNDGLPFSQSVLAGDTLYVSGSLGLVPETGLPPEDPAEEARIVLENIRRAVERAGMTMADLVSVQVFCPDLTLYDTFNTVYRAYFEEGKFPARAFIGSGPLLRGARFEVLGVAVRSESAP